MSVLSSNASFFVVSEQIFVALDRRRERLSWDRRDQETPRGWGGSAVSPWWGAARYIVSPWWGRGEIYSLLAVGGINDNQKTSHGKREVYIVQSGRYFLLEKKSLGCELLPGINRSLRTLQGKENHTYDDSLMTLDPSWLGSPRSTPPPQLIRLLFI